MLLPRWRTALVAAAVLAGSSSSSGTENSSAQIATVAPKEDPASVTTTLLVLNLSSSDIERDPGVMAEEESEDLLVWMFVQVQSFFSNAFQTTGRDFSRNVRQGVSAIIIIAIFGVAFALKDFWFDAFYQMTFAYVHCGSIRNCPGVGWFCSHVCCCLGLCGYPVPPYHPYFRLRILVHEAHNFKGNAMYVRALCGNNPPKSTSMMKIPVSTMYPVVWNEPLDLDITTADEEIQLEVVDFDGHSCGLLTLTVSSFYNDQTMFGNLEDGKYLKEGSLKKAMLGGNSKNNIGSIVFSLYATEWGKPLKSGLGHNSSSDAEPLVP